MSSVKTLADSGKIGAVDTYGRITLEKILTERCPVKCPKCYAHCIYELGHTHQVIGQVAAVVKFAIVLPTSELYHVHWVHGKGRDLSSKRAMHRWR